MDRPYVLGVDLDGVCGDYTGAFRTVVAEQLGCSLDDLPLQRSWDFSEWGLDDEEFERLHHHAVTERRILSWMPVLDGAADALWRLSDAGVWIRIITHRLYVNWSHATAIADTVEWLDRVRIPYRDICFMGDKPEVGADLYIDDGPHNVEALREVGNRVIIFDAPYNQHLGGTRARTWTECEQLVLRDAADRGYEFQVALPGLDQGSDRLDDPGQANPTTETVD
jgi:5'(3')-deoxyribonucleotidase